jgi:hypothetical protein
VNSDSTVIRLHRKDVTDRIRRRLASITKKLDQLLLPT